MADTKMLFARKDRRSTSYNGEAAFTFEDHFIWLGKLGSGSFSDVHLVEHKVRTGERYAIKCSKKNFKSRKERQEYLNEVQLANNIETHPNVVEYFRAWQDSFKFYVQMELCENGTLGQLIQLMGAELRKRESEERVWEMVTHIARGLAHIHGYDVIHCDLKPDNILVARDGTFKIGDLGHATALKAWNEQEGDAKYLSRDLLDLKPSTKADIFSFGIMLYEIKSGEALPGSGTRWDFLRSGLVPLLGEDNGCSEAFAIGIKRMMAAQPQERPTAEEVLAMRCDAAAHAALQAATSSMCQ